MIADLFAAFWVGYIQGALWLVTVLAFAGAAVPRRRRKA